MLSQSGRQQQVASVPTAYRTLEEIAAAGTRAEWKLTAAVSAARRYAWSRGGGQARQAARGAGRGQDARRGDLHPDRRDRHPGAHSDKELAEANFKGLCDVMPLAVSERVGGGQ
jgi:hypothetical protein